MSQTDDAFTRPLLVARIWAILLLCFSLLFALLALLMTSGGAPEWSGAALKLSPFLMFALLTILAVPAVAYLAPLYTDNPWLYCVASCFQLWLVSLFTMAGFWGAVLTSSLLPYLVGAGLSWLLIALLWPRRGRWNKWLSRRAAAKAKSISPGLPAEQAPQPDSAPEDVGLAGK